MSITQLYNPGVLNDWELGPMAVYFGDRNGKYPDANTLLVRGTERCLLVDPSLGYVHRVKEGLDPGSVDLVLHSHFHEDHLAGTYLYPGADWWIHEADADGLRSMEGFLALYGMVNTGESPLREMVERQFNYTPREDVACF